MSWKLPPRLWLILLTMQTGFAASELPIPKLYDQPVINFRPNTRSIPFQEYILRDPVKKRKIIPDFRQAQELGERINKRRLQLTQVKKSFERTLILRKNYEDYDQLADFYQNSSDSSIQPKSPLENVQARTESVQKALIDTANQLLKEQLGPEERITLNFQLALRLVGRQDTFEAGLKTLLAMKTIANLDPKRLQTIEILNAANLAHSATMQSRAAGVAKLKNLANMDSQYGSTYIHLATARSLAGFDWYGQRVSKALPEYKQQLNTVSRLCNTYTAADKNRIFDFSYSIWTQSEALDANLIEPPFKLNCFQKAEQISALIERMALAKLRSGEIDNALVLYQKIENMTRNQTLAEAMNWQILQIMQGFWQKGLRADEYQDALIASLKIDRSLQHIARIRNLHQEFTERELKNALKNEAQKGSMQVIRQRWIKFVTHHDDQPAIRGLRPLWASVLLASNLREETIQELYRMAQDPDMKLRAFYGERALELYAQDLKWDLEKPWATTLPSDRDKVIFLQKLIQLRTQLPLHKKRADWIYNLQLAIIEKELDQFKASMGHFNLAFSSITDRKLMARCYSAMVALAYQQNSWLEMQQLIQKGLKLDLAFQVQEISGMNNQSLIVMAIERQIQNAIAEKNNAKVLEKISEILLFLKPSTQRNETLLLEASIAQENKLYDRALKSLDTIANEKVLGDAYQTGLIKLARLLVQMGEVEKASKIYESYLVHAVDDASTTNVYEILGDLQRAQKKYSAARQSYVKFLVRSTSSEQVEAVGIKLLHLTQEAKKVSWMDEDLKDLSALFAEQPRLRAMFLAYSQQKSSGNQKITLSDLTAGFNDEEKQFLAVNDLLSWKALQEAKSQATTSFDKAKAAVTGNRAEIIYTLSSAYKASYANYLLACQSEFSGYCAPALSSLMQDLLRYKELAQSWVITSTDPTVSKDQRDRLIANLDADRDAVQRRLTDVIRGGYTDPAWLSTAASAEQNLWNVPGDSSTDKLSFIDFPLPAETNKE